MAIVPYPQNMYTTHFIWSEQPTLPSLGGTKYRSSYALFLSVESAADAFGFFGNKPAPS